VDLVGSRKRSVCGLGEDFPLAERKATLSLGNSGCVLLVEGHRTFCLDRLESLFFGERPELLRGRPINN